VRYFTVREAARLQTFPDDYYFPCTWGESMRQIGNAVPVTLAYIIAASIRNHLEEFRHVVGVSGAGMVTTVFIAR
jgi:DNA (cytosine-5)-methyltransferase 1